MPKITTLEAFKAIGGEPSNKLGSGYSAICKVLDKITDLGPNYWSAPQRTLLADLASKLQTYHAGGLADGTPEKKRKNLEAVTQLKSQLADYKEAAKISVLIDKMEVADQPLIRNTALGLKKFTFSFIGDPNVNAFFTGAACIAVNTTLFWVNEKTAIGILVHEYHHSLTRRLPAPYKDEFVAHWKQYLAMGITKTVEELNYWLCDDPKGYKLRNKPNLPNPLFTRVEDAGGVWTTYKDNIIHQAVAG
jgi:hypothetical protein